jgi:hypothetical protein
MKQRHAVALLLPIVLTACAAGTGLNLESDHPASPEAAEGTVYSPPQAFAAEGAVPASRPASQPTTQPATQPVGAGEHEMSGHEGHSGMSAETEKMEPAGAGEHEMSGHEGHSGMSAETETMETVAQDYTCPMHPDVHEPAPGDCPICGMTLEAHQHAK